MSLSFVFVNLNDILKFTSTETRKLEPFVNHVNVSTLALALRTSASIKASQVAVQCVAGRASDEAPTAIDHSSE